MAKPIRDPDGHLKNYCIVSRAVCEVFPRAVTNEIYRYTTPFALQEMMNEKEFLSWIPMPSDQTEESNIERALSVTENVSLTNLCHILQFFQSRQPSVEHYIVSPRELSEIKTLLKELYLFGDERMIPKKEFKTLWRKIKLISKTFDKRCRPKLIPYHQQMRNIKKHYRYGQEEETCHLMTEQWNRETESLKQEVLQLKYMYRETISRNKYTSIFKTLANSLKRFRRRHTKIGPPAEYTEHKSLLCISNAILTPENEDQLQVIISPLHDCDEDNKKHSRNSSRDFLKSESNFQPMIMASPCLMTGMNEGNDLTEFNALLSEESSIFEMEMPDDDMHTTTEKYVERENVQQTLDADDFVRDEITNQQADFSLTWKDMLHQRNTEKRPDTVNPENLCGNSDSTNQSTETSHCQSEHTNENEMCQVNELQLSRKFGSEHEFRTESHCPGPPDKEAGTAENKSGFLTSCIHTAGLSQFTNFVTSATLSSPFPEPRSFLWSSSVASEGSRLPASSIHEDSFGDLGCKTDTTYVDKMSNLVFYIQSSSQGLLSALDRINGIGQESVLMLNFKLISQSVSVVKEETRSALSPIPNKPDQSSGDQIGRCSETHFKSDEDSLKGSHGQADNETFQFEMDLASPRENNVRNDTLHSQKHGWKREKEELKKKVMKRLYSSLWKGKVSKKKYHQAIRRASLQCLMGKFFKNFNQVSKKDKNELSKIINHYFNLLAYSGSRSLLTHNRPSPNFPVGRNTPTTLEAFFQDLVESEDVAAADTMHVEWMRLRTFWSFPTSTNVSTVQLARDGFFYTGHTTETRCFCCRSVYGDWDETSDINAIHRRLSPNCDMANGRSTRNFSIHDQHGGINILERVNPETSASAQNQTTQQNTGETQTTQQNSAESQTTQQNTAESQTTQQNTGETQTTQQNTAESVSEEEPDRSGSEAAQSSLGNEPGKQPAAQSPKPSKSKLKRDKKKKKKELASSNQSPAGGFVVTEVPQTVESSDVTSSGTATASTEREVDAASNATTNAKEKTLAAARSTAKTAVEAPAIGGLQIQEVQHHSAPQPTDRSQQGQRSVSPSSSSPSIPPSTSQSQRSQQPQERGGANPPAPSQGGANPPGPTSAERLAQLDPLGINFDKPKYPSYAVYSNRHGSFEGWPSHMVQTPREMSRAGFYYAGYGDYARCFFCGGGLRNWDRSDDPWIEHARWFPRCAFLRNNKGDKYVARVQRRHQEQEAGLEPSSQLPPPQERDMDTSIAQALREMGYHNQIIQRAMNDWRGNLIPGRRHPPPMTAASILDIIEKIQSTDQVQTVQAERPLTIPGMQNSHAVDGSTQSSLPPSVLDAGSTESPEPSVSDLSDSASALEENRTESATVVGQPRDHGYTQRETQEKKILQEDFLGLTETLVCKVCCDKDVAAAFLPCGHLVCCLDCAPAMRKCPLCDELIKGTVKTYFS